MLLFEHCHSLLLQVAASPYMRLVTTSVHRALAVTSTLWGCLLELTGDHPGAAARYAVALSEVAAMSAGADSPDMRWRAQALEGFLLQRFGEDGLALARLQEALRGFEPRESLVEVRAARLAEALLVARLGDGPAARALLALGDVRVHENQELWEALSTATSAEVALAGVEDPAAREAALGWRRMSELAMTRLWRDREGRFEALADRRRVQTLVQEAQERSSEVLTDPLTGLGNRRLLQDHLDAEADRLRGGRRSDVAALLFVDVDEFKNINDTCSHGTGDVVLQRLGRLVDSACRVGDTAIRYGGDEFVVLLSDAAGAAEAGDRLLAAVRAENWSALDPRLTVRVSVGVAVRSSVAEALAAADEALFTAKRTGRDRLVEAGRSTVPRPGPVVVPAPTPARVPALTHGPGPA